MQIFKFNKNLEKKNMRHVHEFNMTCNVTLYLIQIDSLPSTLLKEPGSVLILNILETDKKGLK
jgi:hypothetical protein